VVVASSTRLALKEWDVVVAALEPDASAAAPVWTAQRLQDEVAAVRGLLSEP
jgi:hypothetical protein